jgi:curved DNA-binding protein CbpA
MSSVSDRLITDLFREIAQNNRSGLLRLTSGRVIKAIFFEGGIAVFGISNQANEQIDYALLERGWVTQAQINKAKEVAGQPNKLGQTLVSTGILDKSAIDTASLELAKQIILSVFGWVKAESAFDERVRAVHDVRVQWSAAECILEGVRAAAAQARVAEALVPNDAMVTIPPTGGKLASTGKLNPVESYVLSRIEAPTQAGELASLTGLGEEESQRALCSLIAIGLVTIVGENAESEAAAKDFAMADVEDDIDRKTDFFAHADHYEILGVVMRSPAAEIKAAYYNLAKKYHPDRYRQPGQQDIRAKLESLFSRISQAYETLGDPTQRALYDEQLRKTGRLELPKPPVKPVTPPPPPAQPVRRDKPRTGTAPLPPRQDKPPAASAPLRPSPDKPRAGSSALPPNPEKPQAAPTPSPVPSQGNNNGGEPKSDPLSALKAEQKQESQSQAANSTPEKTAEFYYQQARTRIDQKDYYGALQLLRECVKLDPGRPQYHFHLGMNLLKNPRTRHEGEYHLAKAAQLDPFNAQIRMKVGTMYKEAGLAKKAEHFFREALALDPSNRAAMRELQPESGKKKGGDEGSIWKSDLGTIAKRLLKK